MPAGRTATRSSNALVIAIAAPPSAAKAMPGSVNCIPAPTAVATAQRRATAAIPGCEALTHPAVNADKSTSASSV